MKVKRSTYLLSIFVIGALVNAPASAALLNLMTSPPSGTPLPPFVLITQDDSKTMGNEWVILEGDTDDFNLERLFPDDSDDGEGKSIMYFDDDDADDKANIKLRNYRYNTIYYNPNVEYKPWPTPPGMTPYPPADLDCAPYDPRKKSHCLPLFEEQELKAKWCKDEVCESTEDKKKKFHPAVYYLGNKDGSGNQKVEVHKGDAEAQNFANWFTYHRSRTAIAKGAFGVALKSFPETFEVGYTNIHKTDGVPLVRVKPFSGSHKKDVYEELYDDDRQNQTPTRHTLYATGVYFQGLQAKGSCQRYFNILMSDGLWSDDAEDYKDVIEDGDKDFEYTDPKADRGDAKELYKKMLKVKDEDSTESNLPNGAEYKPIFPFRDGIKESDKITEEDYVTGINPTLADIAMYWWKTPLKPGNNVVTPTANDPATWQHLVNYTISFGVDPTILGSGVTNPPVGWPSPFTKDHKSVDDVDFKMNCYKSNKNILYEDSKCSGATEIKYTVARVYDLWHAAINSRGQFFTAQDTPTLVASINSILKSISVQGGAGSSISLNTTALSTSTPSFVYQATYDGSWAGDLAAFKLDSTGKPGAAPSWSATQPSNTPIPDKRIIITKAAGVNTKGTPFRWNSLDSSQKIALNGSPDAATGEVLVNYLRGDNSNPSFRKRAKWLGDIIGSSPLYVGPPPFKYASAAYTQFVTTHKNRAGMIYVGANDGMLHAFDTNGKERFAYVPGKLLNVIKGLSDPNYVHRYFVNGPIAAGDVEFTDGSWHTVLVGTLAGGGQAVFALDVTNPGANPTVGDFITENAAANKVLWEFSDTETDPSRGSKELGYTFSRPSIVKVNTPGGPKWVAIFGNGYNNTEASATDPNPSTTGRAALYIIDIETGKSMIPGPRFKIEVPATSVTPNGLATPAVIDKNGDGIADYVYAGDLAGNLWKFDISSNNVADWGIARTPGGSAAPLFTANFGAIPQAITTQPEVGLHSTGKGVMIYFGTGRYLDVSDPTDRSTQNTFYGIWDDNTRLGLTRADLQAQTIIQEISGTYTKRVTSANTFTWRPIGGAPTTGKMGWFLDLRVGTTPTGERVMFAPLLDGNRILFSTFIPEVSSDLCIAADGSGWIMELDAAMGTRTETAIFDFNNDKAFTAADMVSLPGVGNVAVSGVKSKVGIPSAPSVVKVDGALNQIIFGGSDGKVSSITSARSPTEIGRQSWRQLL